MASFSVRLPLVTLTVRAPVLAPDSIEIFVDSSVELTKLVDDGYTIVLLGTPKHAEVVG